MIAIFGIMAYLLIDKFVEVASTTANVLDAAKEVQDGTREIIGALDSLKATGGVKNA